MSKKLLAIHALLVVLSLMITTDVHADPQDMDDPPSSDVPIDGGALILVGSAVAYSVKKKMRTKSDQQS